MVPGPQQRRTLAIEVATCLVLLVGIAFFALGKMDYLAAKTAHHARMTDNSRSAYVAKNLVEGEGYTASELPAFLIDFYDRQHKLHDDHWVNADRFPFTTCAIAALFFVTRTTSWQVGIVGYNLICFVGFYALLYWLARRMWRDRWAALATLGIALLHPLAYVYPLFMKDADMLALTAGVIAAAFRYYSRPPEQMTWKLGVLWGTLLAWLFLDRPNVGGAFTLYVGLIVARRIWVARKELGLAGALRAVAGREAIVLAAFAAWCVPFAVHSLSEWGSPFFTANAMYQMPLGTRFAMDTDTWYKYSEPGKLLPLGTLAHEAGSQLVAKFTTSWVSTLKVIVRSFAIELVLAVGLLAVLARRMRTATVDASERRRDRSVYLVARMVGFAVLCNFALLPLYGYQNYPYRHYLSFFEPLVWLLAGQAIVQLVRLVRPTATRAWDYVREHRRAFVLALIIGVLAWNAGAKSSDENELFARTANFAGAHWLTAAILLALVLWGGWLRRVPAFPAATIVLVIFILVRFEPYAEMKRYNLNWFPADEKVWDTLRERKGLVMSFALQGEVNWVSGRRNIPAPELPMHVYSLLFDHDLEVEDLYIESAETMISPYDGPFFGAGPGFEGYARLEKFQAPLPGYQIVFHTATVRGYPKFGVTRPRPKASTIYRLVDRDAVRAMAHSPARLELGRVEQAIYTAYGWGKYYTLDGRPAVAATDAVRARYGDVSDGIRPWEDTSATFFLDDRRPTSIDLEIYAVRATTLQWFWNLDLYAYDAPHDRDRHAIGKYAVVKPGWQTVHLEIPPGLTRKGLNKLGFRAGDLTPVAMCPPATPDGVCAAVRTSASSEPPVVVHDDHVESPSEIEVSTFVGSLVFHYEQRADH
jgi:hypothetical protein